MYKYTVYIGDIDERIFRLEEKIVIIKAELVNVRKSFLIL